MRKSYLFIIILLAFANLANAQYQIKIKAINTLDTVIYFRGTVFDEKNFIPKDTINLYKGSFTLSAKKPILGGIYFSIFQNQKLKFSSP